MTEANKKKSRAALVIFVLLCCAALCACGSGANVKVLPEKTEDVQLGAMYETAQTFTDGTTAYDVSSVTVRRESDGKTVTLIYGAFDVVEKTGYTVEYTASTESGTVKQVVKLRVIDTSAPVIFTPNNGIASVGTKYLFPETSLQDDSGEQVTPQISVKYRADGSAVECDGYGFTPTAIGYYDITISAEDSAGNRAEDTYSVYARTALKVNELDGLDDEGLIQTVYSKNGTVTVQASLSALRRTSQSAGSAYLPSGTGERTGFYFTPRNDSSVMDQYGDDGFISVWVYIADFAGSVRTAYFGNSETELRANVWQNIKISSAQVGDYKRFFDRLSTGGLPLFEVENTGGDYSLFVDGIFAERGGLTVSGLNDSYAAGDEVSFTVSGAPVTKAEYWYAGETAEITGQSFVAENEGTYTVNIYADDLSASYARTFTVGSRTSEFNEEPWYRKSTEGELPEVTVKQDGAAVAAQVSFEQVDLVTGQSYSVNKVVPPSEGAFGLVLISVYNGVVCRELYVLPVREYARDVFYDTDSADAIESAHVGDSSITFSFMETFDGETGVVCINNNTGEEAFFNNRAGWQPIYSKEHYAEYDYLIFRMKASVPKCRLSYIGEDVWKSITVSNNISTEWTEYRIDINEIIDNFESMTATQLFWTDNMEKQPYVIYISDIKVAYEPVIPADQMTAPFFDTDSAAAVSDVSVGSNTHISVSHKDSYDGETGVVCINNSTGIEAFFNNRSGWRPVYSKESYSDFDYLVFRVKASVPKCRLSYIGENGWINLTVSNNISTEWTDYYININKIIDNFESMTEEQLFWTDNMDKQPYTIYISDIRVEKKFSPPETGLPFPDDWLQ